MTSNRRDDHELSPEGKFIATMITNITKAMADGDENLTSILIRDAPVPEELPLFNTAVNHCINSVSYEIARQSREQPQSDDGQLRGSIIVAHTMAIRTTLLWAKQHLDEALTIQEDLDYLSNLHSLSEEDFNERSREQNCHAVREARKTLTAAVPIPNLDPSTRHYLQTIRDICANNLRNHEQQPEVQDPLYQHDSHFDEYTTFTWADLLLQASEPDR